MNLQPVILCGGAGTRLWPLSREQYPKQLLALIDDKSMLQATACRVDASLDATGTTVLPPIVVSNEDYRFITAEQLRQAGHAQAAIVLEPKGRNTAPALTLAALAAQEAGEDPVLLVMPADHIIGDVVAFRAEVVRGLAHAAAGKFVTFGIGPTRAETGFGYIRAGTPLAGGAGAREIVGFVEKPDITTAERYVASGEYLWNSGIFMMRASAWFAQLGALRPDVLDACRAAYALRSNDRDFLRVGAEAFAACPADSIDYAVMEKLPPGLGVVIPLAAGWSDVGAWDALWQIGNKDRDGNVTRGDVMTIDSRDTLAISQSRLVACVGLADAVVVETPDAVLVAHKDHMQQVKEVVMRLKREGRSEADAHRKVYRPWGYYDSVDDGSRFQVKRIVVKPGAALSLQMHHHRAEHWIVVSGTALVTRGDDSFLVSENESTYIPIGTRHRLQNPGKLPLEIIEVQSGAYLGEDDIVRFEDTYGRS
ncbi:MAG: mannose-phosphate guanylyltransferase/mannose-6-phosphate isomerase [Betaproteobacteria bacterium]|nr:mannose-phosphate guanylyltransferase/mannose-6-phosphate isomerase [Betaproteobacteria bacterium]